MSLVHLLLKQEFLCFGPPELLEGVAEQGEGVGQDVPDGGVRVQAGHEAAEGELLGPAPPRAATPPVVTLRYRDSVELSQLETRHVSDV